MSTLKLGINEYVTNEAYHADREYLSSSAYKLMLKSAKDFAAKYVNPAEETEEQAENPAFSEGSLVHALILEPHLVNEEFAFFPGFRKQGVEYREFKKENAGKTIISASQKKRCDKCLENYKQNSAATTLTQEGEPELTMTGDILGIPTKARADWINVEQGYIADVKTTSWGSDQWTFKDTMERYGYGLSAALYIEIAKQCYGKDFDFYFIVLSKKEPTCDVYKLSDRTKQRGHDDLFKAANKYKKCKETGLWVDQHDIVREQLQQQDYEILEV